jgi:hypothetical protein
VDEVRFKFGIASNEEHAWFSVGKTTLPPGTTVLLAKASVRRADHPALPT